MKISLDIDLLKKEASAFSILQTDHLEPSLFGVTDGKAVGTYLEHKFQDHLQKKYQYSVGSSAYGLDFPSLNIDIKVTSIRQPQSSCPFRSARQKIYGLGYGLIVFVYNKTDDENIRAAKLEICHTIYIDKSRTSDFQLTTQLRKILSNSGNIDDIMALFHDRNLPIDEIESLSLAQEVLKNPPEIGYLTISNALQWRLQYQRAIDNSGKIDGVDSL